MDSATRSTLRSVAPFLASRFLYMLSFQIRSVTVGWQVYAITQDPMSLGILGLCQFLPVAGLSLIAGQIADRFDRKPIVVICQVVDLLISLALCLVSMQESVSVHWLYLIFALLGANRSFAGAAGQSILPSLVEREHFSKAAAWSSSVWQIAVTIGPAMGGLIYGFSHHPSYSYATATLATSCALLFSTRLKPRKEQLEKSPVNLETLFAGLKFLWSQKTILGAISMDLFAVLFGGAVALMPAIASDVLKVGPEGFGILRSAPGIGAALMGVFLSFHPIKEQMGKRLFGAVAVFGIATILFGLSRNFWLSLALLVIMGASDLISVVIRSTVVQLLTPPQMRGRVSAINLVFIGASNELGEFESGVTASWWGVVPAIIVGGVGTCAVVVLWRKFFPSLYHTGQV